MNDVLLISMERGPTCGEELNAEICVHCDSGNVFIKSNVQSGVREKRNVITNSIFIGSNVDLSTTIKLYVDDEAERIVEELE